MVDASREDFDLAPRTSLKFPAWAAARAKGSKPLILFVITNPQRLSGSNKSLLALLKQLGEKERVAVCLTGEGEMAVACREVGLRVELLNSFDVFRSKAKPFRTMSLLKLLWISLFQYPIFIFQSLWLLRRVQPDIVHANDPKTTLFLAPAVRLLRIPLVSHLRGEKPFGAVISAIYEAIPFRFLAVSKATKGSLSLSVRSRAAVVYNGVGEGSGEGAGVEWLQQQRSEGKVVILTVASVVPFKGLHHLCRAIAKMSPGARENATVVIVGDLIREHHDYYQSLLDHCREKGVANITFAGWQRDVEPFYRSADILVLPSVSSEELRLGKKIEKVRGSEGLPRAILEAFSFGVPVVASAIAGVPEQIEHGKNGFLVPPGNSEALAYEIERLISDKELRIALGQESKVRVAEKFSLEMQVEQFRAVCSEVRRR